MSEEEREERLREGKRETVEEIGSTCIIYKDLREAFVFILLV